MTLKEILHDDIDISWIPESKHVVYSLIAALLGKIYYQVDWRRISTSKIATDIFEHRIKHSSRKPTVPTFINKLCNQLSIQALHDQPELVLAADQHREEFLKTIRTESQLCVMLARRYAQKLKKQTHGENTPADN